MVRILVCLVQLLFCFLLQSSIFSFLRISGVVPNCMLILVIAVAYTRGQNSSIVTGFFAGLLTDLWFSDMVGLCSILYMVIGFLAGYSNKIYDKRDYITPLLMVTVGEFVYSFLYFVLCFLLRGKLDIGNYMIYTILPRIMYTLLAAIALYPLFLGTHCLLQRLEGQNHD
ncbi:MAG: rod shape-determining protein MreD [Lachnospiraceae bacterium]